MATAAVSAKPVYALVGDDSFLQVQALEQLARQLPSDAARIEFDGERAELSDVLDELRSFAMFGGGKIVIVRNGDEFITRFREQLEDYVAEPSSTGTLVLRVASLPKNQRLYKAVAKVGSVVECQPPSPRELPGWIANRAKSQHKITLAPDAAALLADLIGADLGRLDNELAKLALQVESGAIVSAKDISGSIAFQREQELLEMTSRLGAGDVRGALQCWRRLVQLDTSAEFRAVTWLTMWLEDVRQVWDARRQKRRPETIKNYWKYKDGRFPAFLRTVDKLGEPGFVRALNLLAEVDKQSKSGVGDAAENVERFIVSLATT